MPAPMRYVGIDLAWGRLNTTAVVILEATSDNPATGAAPIAMADDLLTNDDIIGFVERHVAPDSGVVVAIDAPTIVPNATGKRPCEAILSRCLHREQAGPHPANRRLLGGVDDRVRGEVIAGLLAERGIPQTPYLDEVGLPLRACFEAFPHPAHIALFGLERTLKYKAKPKRLLADRLAVFRRYVDLLIGLHKADPPLLLPDDSDAWWRRDPAQFTAKALKRHEDALDALTCAYIALYRHRWGDARTAVVGDLVAGYIVTPVTPGMRECFDKSPTPQPPPSSE